MRDAHNCDTAVSDVTVGTRPADCRQAFNKFPCIPEFVVEFKFDMEVHYPLHDLDFILPCHSCMSYSYYGTHG